MHTAADIEKAIRAAADPKKVKVLSGFFKTDKGKYGEGDIFIGIPVPITRSIVKQYLDTPLDQLEILLHNPVHELRMAALLCMVEQKGDSREARGHIPHLPVEYGTHQQLGFGRFVGRPNRGRLSRKPRPHSTVPIGTESPPLGATHLYRRHLAMDSQRSLRRHSCPCRYTLAPPPRPYPQSCGLDAARSGKARQNPALPIPRRPIPRYATHHVALCNREIPSRGTSFLYEKVTYNNPSRRHCRLYFQSRCNNFNEEMCQ